MSPVPSSAHRRGPLLLAAALALVLAVAPWLPGTDGAPEPDEHGALAPATDHTGALPTPVRTEIDRVVQEGLAARAALRSTDSRLALAQSAVRCAQFSGQRYCLGVGWTTSTEAELREQLVAAAAPGRASYAEGTGDLGPVAALHRRARMSPRAQARADRRELTAAARSVAKVWELRHAIEGDPLPDGWSATTAGRTTTGRHSARYPGRDKVLSPRKVRAQKRTYWCGPATMQMIGWGWSGDRKRQRRWARRLGTTSAGTAITEMVRVINRRTGWDRDDHADTYIALDIGDYRFRQWYQLLKRHIHDYRAPVVLHPILIHKYFPYLDDDASGHFQVGRGYDNNPDGPRQVGYFEPWNQRRFDPSEPFIARVQWRSAYKSFRANKAHFQHNIGV